MEEHGDAEDAEDDVDFPGDVLKGGRDKVGECKIEDPVCRGAEGDCFAADAERVEFWWVDPLSRS